MSPYFLYTLNQHGDSHAAADAKRCQSAFRVTFFHFVKQRRRDSHAGASDRMAQCNCATVDVKPLLIKLQLAIARDDLRGECFIQFD